MESLTKALYTCLPPMPCGRNICPDFLEATYFMHNYIQNSTVINPGDKYLACWTEYATVIHSTYETFQ